MRFRVSLIVATVIVGLLLSFSVAFADERDPEQRSPQRGACRVAMATDLLRGYFKIPKADNIDQAFYRFRADVYSLCGMQPDSSRLGLGQAVTWLETADAAVERLLDRVSWELVREQNANSLSRLYKLTALAHQLEYELGPMRTQGYQAFRTYLEITNFCANSHEHAAQWANQLEDWHGRASLTGNDRKWVDDSIVSLRAAAKGEKDLQAAVTDFLVREILRSNIAGNDLGGPISDITKEMRRMIIVCGW